MLLTAGSGSGNYLHEASRRGDDEAVRTLLNSADRNGLIPNCECWFFGSFCEICSVDDTHKGGLAPTMYATGQGHYEVLRLLINKGANLNLQNAEGHTAAMHAAIPGDEELLQMIITAGGDIQLPTKLGWTPLMATANMGHDGCLKMLTEAGASVNVQATNGWSAVMYAAANGHASTLELLIKLGANLSLTNNVGTTATHVAGARGHIRCLKMLLSAAPELRDKRDQDRNTLAMVTAKAGMPKVLRALLKVKADMNATNADGQSAALLAASEGHVECLSVLLLEAKVPFEEKAMRKHIKWGAKTSNHEAKLRDVIDSALTGKYVQTPDDVDEAIAKAEELVAKAEAEADEAEAAATREREEALEAQRAKEEAEYVIAQQQWRREKQAEQDRVLEEQRLKELLRKKEEQEKQRAREYEAEMATKLKEEEGRLATAEAEASAAEAAAVTKKQEIQAAKRLLEAARAQEDL